MPRLCVWCVCVGGRGRVWGVHCRVCVLCVCVCWRGCARRVCVCVVFVCVCGWVGVHAVSMPCLYTYVGVYTLGVLAVCVYGVCGEGVGRGARRVCGVLCVCVCSSRVCVCLCKPCVCGVWGGCRPWCTPCLWCCGVSVLCVCVCECVLCVCVSVCCVCVCGGVHAVCVCVGGVCMP